MFLHTHSQLAIFYDLEQSTKIVFCRRVFLTSLLSVAPLVAGVGTFNLVKVWQNFFHFICESLLGISGFESRAA